VIVSNGNALGFPAQALGETTPSLSNGYFYAQNGLMLSNVTATYGALYKAQPSIATLVDKIAASAARLKGKVWDNTPATGRVEDTSSGFSKLMANPCTEMSTFNFYRWTFATYEVYGEVFWYKQRRDQKVDSFGIKTQSGPTVNLLPMHPARTMVHRDNDGNVEYVFTLGVASAGILRAPETDVVAFRRYNPDSLMRGMSRLEPLRSTLLNEDASRRATQSWWKRGARPSVVLKHPGELSPQAADRLQAKFDANHAGADNMGRTNVLEEGLDLQVIQLNAEEMQYIESRKLNMQEACMVYDVPPPVVHILDHATFSNITEQMRSMYRDTMSPRLEDIESTVDFSLRPEFFGAGEREFEFDMSDVLRGDYETRVDKALAARQSGLITGNEGRAIIGESLSTNPEMDKIYANAALVPLGTPPVKVAVTEAQAPDPGLQQVGADGADKADAAKAVTVRAVMGKLARVKGNKSEIRKSLVEQHAAELKKFFAKQGAAVHGRKSVDEFDPEEWDDELAGILEPLAIATSSAIGANVAEVLNGKYDPAQLADWLKKNSATSATNINATTAKQLQDLIDRQSSDGEEPDIDGFFDDTLSSRADQISDTRVGTLAGLASVVAAEQNDARTKTWVTTSANPRPAHAAMDGETVGLNEQFSNGMNGPGDFSGGGDEVAGCTCDLEFSKEG
jgi:HK97 family phage portal protein